MACPVFLYDGRLANRPSFTANPNTINSWISTSSNNNNKQQQQEEGGRKKTLESGANNIERMENGNSGETSDSTGSGVLPLPVQCIQ